MSTLTGICNSALSALNTYTYAISITSTNISNSENSSYSRQTAVLTTGTGGSGVDVAQTKRIYSLFLTERLRSATTELGKRDAENNTLASVEEVFTSTSSYGLSSAMDIFWSSWQEVVTDPTSSTALATLVASAETLTNDLSSMSIDLSNIQKDIDTSVEVDVTNINDLVRQIAGMNRQIADDKAAGVNTNADEDSLDALVLSLSKLVDITTYTDSSTGEISVNLADGNPLVNGTTTCSLTTQTNATTGLQDMLWTNGKNESSVITGNITGGELGGYLDVRDSLIPAYKDKLDTLAATLVEAINSLCIAGYDSSGNAGTSFFTGTSAADIAVSSSIIADPTTIAVSSSSTTTNSSIAQAIADLQNTSFTELGGSTFSDYYDAMVSSVGSTASSADSSYSAASAKVTSCQTLRDSVSAVSTDEELVKLTLYQNAYAAAAKAMTTVEELLKTLINSF
ncbi:MAG: flagellar hook-associated protein FlgK [Smithella sp.]